MISQTALVLFCCFCCSAVFHLASALVKGRVAGVEILAVKIILRYTNGVGEALIVNYFSCAQEFYYIVYVGVVGKAKDVVVGCSSLLFCYYHVFATFWGCQKTRKILIFQGLSALLKLTIFQKFQ